jgi:predicted dehydrogenase
VKFLIVGLGSAGKRRIRNLKYLQSGIIIGCDPHLDTRDEASQRYRIHTFEDFFEAMLQDPDALIICAPPDLRIHFALEATKAHKHFFTEAALESNQLAELIPSLKGKNMVAAPSCLGRFYPGPKRIQKLFREEKAIGRPLTFTYHFSQYTGDRQSLEVLASTSINTHIWKEMVLSELIWLSELFGKIESISPYRGKSNDSEAEANAVQHLLIQFESGLTGHLLADVVSQTPIHHLQIVGTDGNIEWDDNEQVVKIYSVENRLWRTEPLIRGCVENMYINPEEPYIDEMRCFLEAVQGITSYPFTFERIYDLLNLLSQIEAGWVNDG